MSGRKTFVAGEILTASDVNSFLMDQSVMVFDDSAARTTAIPTPSEGMVTYRKDGKSVEVFDGSAFTPVGTILQVVSTTKTDTFSASVAANAEVDVTNFNATITPTSANSKILVSYHAHHSHQVNNARVGTVLFRDATAIAIGNTGGSRKRLTTYAGAYRNEANDIGLGSMTFLDSPETTSAVTYKVRLYNTEGATNNLFLNRSTVDSDNANIGRPVSTITLMEVAV